MKKLLFFAALALTLVACDDKDTPEEPVVEVQPVSEGFFVINQGSYYSQIDGSLSYVNYETKAVTNNVFSAANGRSLGASPQCGMVYGEKIYLGVYESNVIEVLDRTSLKSVKQISLSSAEGQGPRSFVAKDGKVYVSMFNGYVSRLDTLSLTIDASVKVGPNPDVIAIKGDKIYVPNSDGMNYQNGYGTTASEIDIPSFTVTKTFTVSLNPTKFVSNGEALFLLCMGDYYDVTSKVYRINDDYSSEYIDEATLVAIDDEMLYYINAPFGIEQPTYKYIDIQSGYKNDLIKDKGVDYPAFLDVDPVTHLIVIGSYTVEMGYPSYTTDGYCSLYHLGSSEVARYDIGVSPIAAFFNTKK